MGTKKIVRLLSTDIDGDMNVMTALRKIKGIGFMFSNAVCLKSGIKAERKISELSSDELKKLETVIKSADFPSWMLNRRKDIKTGKDMHLTGSEIDIKKREDINLVRRIRAYRGIRHELGLPVRGQRTRSSFRTNKTVGVSRKSATVTKKKK